MDLPPELLSYIISWIDCPTELLSLALVNRLLCSLIIPDHLEYRRIKCPLNNDVLWTHLLGRPGLALNVRELQLTCRSIEKLFALNFRNDPLDSTSSIWRIIPKFTHLKAFSSTTFMSKDTLLHLIESIKGHRHLEELSLAVRSVDLTPLSSLQTLFRLTKLAIFYLPNEKNGDSTTSVLSHCLINTPNLTHLRFHAFKPLGLWELLDSEELHWPMLEALTVSCSDHIHHSHPPFNTLPDLYGVVLPNFLRRHPTIKRFSFDVSLVSNTFPVIDTTLLPKLYSLRTELPHALTSLLFPNMSNTITHLQLTKPLSPETTASLLLLETFIFESQESPMFTTSSFFAAAPNIKKMYIQSNPKFEDVITTLDAIEPLKKLTHLLGLFRKIKRHALSEILFDRLPSLNYIDTSLVGNNQIRCMRLLRVVEGSKSGVTFEVVPRSIEDPSQYNKWGDFYEGLG